MKKALIWILLFLSFIVSFVFSQEETGMVIEEPQTELTGVDNVTGEGELPIEMPPEILIPEEVVLETLEPEVIQVPQLLITEVFFDGTDEWVEISNIGSQDFLGTLTLSGVKSSMLELGGMSIPTSGSVVIGDTMSQIVNTSYIQKSLLGLNILDTAALHILLLFSGTILDSFDQEAGVVSSLPNKYGFEKVFQDGHYVIVQTAQDRIYNISGDWVANPGIVYTMYIQERIKPELKITEVYRDGDNEWIEITNIGTGIFEDDIVLSGLYSSLITKENIAILPGQSIIFTDSYSYFLQTGNIYFNSPKFALLETRTIDIKLFVQGDLIDEFFVQGEHVERYNNDQISFEKVGTGTNWITTKAISGRVYNVIPPYIANPGVVFSTGEELEDVSISSYLQAIYAEQLPVSCSEVPQQKKEEISEVFFGDEEYPPYVEVRFLEDLGYEKLLLSGSILEVPVEIPLTGETMQLEKNISMVLSNSSKWENYVINNGYHPSFLLSKQAGRLVLYGLSGQGGQVLDIVYLIGGNTGTSLYFGGISNQCAKVLSQSGAFSPGFDEKFLRYFAGQNSVKIEYVYLTQTGVAQCPSVSGSVEVGMSYSGVIPGPSFDTMVKITNIVYDPEGRDTGNEKISLLILSGESLNLGQLDLLVDGKKKKLQGTLEQGKEETFTGTFGFPNSKTGGQSVTIALKYQDHIFDIYTYIPGKRELLSQAEISGFYLVSSVIDGDTFRIKYKGKTQSIRLIGIDAPESNKTRYRYTQCFGTQAKEYLENLIKGKNISFEFDQTQPQQDYYERFLAYAYIDGEMVNKKILQEGYGKEYTYKISYTYQDEFKEIESRAKAQDKGLWSPSTCGVSMSGIDFQEVGTGENIYSGIFIKISDIIYDPPGSDVNNEVIFLQVFMLSTGEINTIINLYDNFYLQIGEKKKSLKNFNFLQKGENILTGNFGFLNSKETCVSLQKDDYIFDTFCYDPLLEKTGEIITGYSITIEGILPNPEGKDEEKEKILFNYKSEDGEEIDLSSGYYLLINTKKKKLQGILEQGKETALTGTFSFPNTSACVSLKKGEYTFDKLCYTMAKEGVLYTKTNESVEEIETQIPGILSTLKLQKKDNKMCVQYEGIDLLCRTIPAGKLTTQQKNEIKLGRNYINFLMNYLKNNRGVLVRNTEIQNYFYLYSEAKNLIKKGQYEKEVYGEKISIYDLSRWYSKQYKTSLVDIMIINITKIMNGAIQAGRDK